VQVLNPMLDESICTISQKYIFSRNEQIN